MKRREDLYNLGNDYAQVTSAYFETSVIGEDGVDRAYSDGLYHYTIKDAYELSGGEAALNKRIPNVKQEDWRPAEFDGAETLSAETDCSAVFSPDYATAIADGVIEATKPACKC